MKWNLIILFVVIFTGCSTKPDVTRELKYVKFNNESCTFDIMDSVSGKIWLKDSRVVFFCNGTEYSLNTLVYDGVRYDKSVSTFGEGVTATYLFSTEDKSLSFGVEVIEYNGNDWVSLNGWVTNNCDSIVVLDRVRLLDVPSGVAIGGDPDNWNVLSGTSDNIESIGIARKEGKNAVNARSVIGIHSEESGGDAVLGFSIKHAWGSVSISTEAQKPGLTADVSLDVDIMPGNKMYAEAVHMKKGEVVSTLEDMIAATGREVGAIIDGKSFGGWCSWYGFNPFIDNDITEDAVLEFAGNAEKLRSEIPLDVMLLDDGYFTLPGDWTTIRPTFPNGMKYLADKTKEKGLIPGIWIAVSIVHENSEAIKKHSDWVDLNDDGTPRHLQYNWGGKTHSFDVSNPAVLRHIDSLFRVIAHDWGYQYLKLDFNIEPGSNRKDRTITSFEAMRNMYKTIKNAVGDDVFIANCAGSPYSPSIGYAKAGRVGPDVNPNWESVIEGCKRSLLHVPFHRRWWVNDPDCLNMRERGSQLTDAELQTHLTANFMGGGYVMFSDSLAKLSDARRRMLSQALPSYGIAADALDYISAPPPGIPSLFNVPIEKFGEKYAITTLFNWSDSPLSRSVSIASLGLDSTVDYNVYDFWTDSYKGVFKGSYTVNNQQPHSCELLSVRPVMKDKIQIISTDLHLLQGTMEITDITRMNTSPFDAAKDEIWIELSPVSLRNGKIVLAAADGLRIASSQGCKSNLERRKDNLWNLNMRDMKDKVSIVLRVR